MNDLVIYHGSCFDGWTAAWAALHRFPGAELHAGKYGVAPPDVRGRRVVIVDFSYPRDVLLRMHADAEWLRVYDHHKTAQADLEGLDFCVFDMERSGAGIAWDEFGEWPRPPLVDIIEDRDLWRFRLPETKHAMAYIATQDYTLDNWDRLAGMTARDLAEKGASIQEYIDRYGKLAREQVRIEYVGGIQMPTINVPYMNCSDHVNGLLGSDHGYPELGPAAVAAGYFRRADGRWQFSLRSLAPFDCSEIAKSYGGGGHAQAAGFDVAVLPWDAP